MTESNDKKNTHQERPILNVLVVDDQAITIESIRRLLAPHADIKVHGCEDPTLALSVAADIAPSVILQDLVMPDVDGMMLVKFYRAHPKTKDVPIVVLSSKDDAKVKAMAFSAGANDYLVKLPDPIELVARLRYHAAAYHNFLRQDEADQTIAQNKALEARVESRTAELKAALNQLQQTQAKLIHTEKMNSMGQLVAGIAHEVNNPINFIYGNLNYVKGYVQDLLDLVQAYQKRYPTPAPEIDEKLEELDLEFSSADLLKSFVSLRSGAKRIRNLVLSLRNFSRFDEAEIKVVDVHEGIDSTLAMVTAELEGIVVEKNYGNLPLVECCASQINQVFMHVVRNAIDAV
ncbi:MAG: response regulator, partial [Cyanobacteria bacterium J06631_9]